MNNKQAFESGTRGGCGAWAGRGNAGGPWAGFGRGKFGGFNRHSMGANHRPPVNIEETDTAYVIALYAAGLVKEQVKLTVKDDVLTISYPAGPSEETDKADKKNMTYREYHSQSFERSFQLNNKVLTERIEATYTDGILTVTLPKNPATNVPAQTITVG